MPEPGKNNNLLDFLKILGQITALLGVIGAVVRFFILFRENDYLIILVIAALILLGLFLLFYRFAFSRSESLSKGGVPILDIKKNKYKYPKLRRLALIGIGLILVTFFGGGFSLYAFDHSNFVAAFVGTPTPSATNTPLPTFPPTLTPSPTLPPPADSLYYLFVLDASARMNLGFDGSESKWNDLQSSALNHLIYGLPERANYALIVLGGNLVNSTVSCGLPNQQAVTFDNNTKMTLIQTIKNVQPYGVASLADAITLARRIFEDKRGEVHRKLFLFLGGGDDCLTDRWVALKYFLTDYERSGLIDIYTEVVILPDETVDDILIADLQTEITRLGIEEEVGLSAPKNDQELENAVGEIFDQSMNQARPYEPEAVAAQEKINFVKTEIPVFVPNVTKTVVVASPQPGRTSTNVPLPTATIIPPTKTSAPPPPPTATAVPPTEAQKPFLILNPPNGTAYGCNSEALCIQTVTVQWVPEAQIGDNHLSIWVRPLPGEPNQEYYAQASPYYLNGSQWTSTEVYIGQIGDPNGTPFKICAIVTTQVYSRGEYYTELPPSILSYCVNVTR